MTDLVEMERRVAAAETSAQRATGAVAAFEKRLRELEQRSIDAPAQVLEELHKKVFAAVDARPPAPQLYKMDPHFLARFDELESDVRRGSLEAVRETVEGAKPPPAFEPVERGTNQTPSAPQALEEFRAQLAARSLPELKPLQEIGEIDEAGDGKPEAEHIEGATLKPELAKEPQQDGPPSTQKEPAETVSGEPPQNT